jgi:nitrite reductase/ring-hydroxylating ferredoxin subunit
METSMKHPLCHEADVPIEGTRLIPFFGREVHVWRTNGRIRAAANVCLHLGLPLQCRDGALTCPWHGARFALEDGLRSDGPVAADARLMLLPIQVEDGEVRFVWGEPA